MNIEVITNPDEVKKTIPVIKSAWGMPDTDQLVKDILCSFRFHGGLILFAKEGSEVVGIQYSYPGYRRGRIYLYSHMTGVTQNHKYSGIGEKLKLEQKKWALENGFDLIVWTFDPLMNLNANFNIHKLGSISRAYLINFYGEMEDAINFGIPSDRFVAEWHIKSAAIPHVANIQNVVDYDNPEPFPEESSVAVRIPDDYVAMKKKDKERAAQIRIATRGIFKNLFGTGYMVTDYDKTRTSYILQKIDAEKTGLGKNIFI